VRGVGGLEDTITDYTAQPETGTGFKFHDYSKEAVLDAVERALSLYRNKKAWTALVKRCMTEDFSWERSAKEYVGLYKKAIAKHESR